MGLDKERSPKEATYNVNVPFYRAVFSIVVFLSVLAPFACSSDPVRTSIVVSDTGPPDAPSPVGDDAAADASVLDDAPSLDAEAAAPAIVLTPRAARVTVGHRQTFAASVSVGWNVVETDGGTIDATGLYVAPATTGTFHVRATNASSPDNQAIAEVTVVAPGLDLVAGAPGGFGDADGVGRDARFNSLAGIWWDKAGDIYVADSYNTTIRRLHLATGEVTTVAGAALPTQERGTGDCVEGVGPKAAFSNPRSVIGDGAGNLYVTDEACLTVNKIVIATGQVTVLAGKARALGNVDAVGGAARFAGPDGLAWAAPGVLFVGDDGAIRTLNVTTGEVGTVAGTSGQFTNGYPINLVYDGANTLFATNAHSVVKVDLSTKSITNLAGKSSELGMVDATGADARFAGPQGLAFDGTGGLVVADYNNHLLRRIDLQTTLVTPLAGHTSAPFDGTMDDGVGKVAGFGLPYGLASDGAGTLFVAEIARVRSIALSSVNVSTIAGDVQHLAQPSDPPGLTRFTKLQGVVLDAPDGLVATDVASIRAIVLADGDSSFVNNVPIGPLALTLDGPAVLYVADGAGTTISRVDRATGQVTLIAGASTKSAYVDDVGPLARFGKVNGLFADHAGSLFAADTFNCVIRKIDIATAQVTTFSGAGHCGYRDDDKTLAQFGDVIGIGGDAQNLYVSDETRIRVISRATGAATTLAGGFLGYKDAIGVAAQFGYLSGLSVDGAGNLFVADSTNSAIRKVEIATGAVTTVVGVSGQAGVRFGPIASAHLNNPTDVLALPGGDLVIVDQQEASILRLRY